MRVKFLFLLFFLSKICQSQIVSVQMVSDHASRFIVKSTGEFIDNKIWNEIEPFFNDFFIAFDDNGFSYVDGQGKVLTDKKYSSARNFFLNRAAVSINDKWGFINNLGVEIIPLQFDLVYEFHGASTFVKNNNQWYLIDTMGNIKSNLDIDYSWGFDNGIAKVLRGDSIGYMNSNGDIINSSWTKDPSVNPYFFSRQGIGLNNASCLFCPTNFDFEQGNFTNWECYIGSRWPSLNLTLDLSNSTPRHQICTSSGTIDPYGGFRIASPDSSIYAVRIGQPDVPGFGAERIKYEITIPRCAYDYTFTYQYALVFQDPGHLPPDAQPQFKVQLIDAASNQEVSCASVDYTAGYGGASFFTLSNNGWKVYYKSWTPVFINLGKYAGKTLYIQFTTLDCGYGGHWCYAYIDINKCGYSGVYGLNSCTTPVTTTLNGPAGFTSYLWSSQSSLSDTIGTGQHLVLGSGNGIPNNTTVYLQLVPEKGIACSDTIPLDIKPSIIEASFRDQLPQCLNNNAYTFTSTSESNGSNITTNHWDFGANAIDGQDNGFSVNHHFNISGTIPVTLTSTTADGCIDDTTINIKIIPSPQVLISGNNVCAGISTFVTLSGADTYVWSPRTGVAFTSTVCDSAIFPSNNTTLYQVIAEDTTTHCSSNFPVQVKFFPNPIADFDQPASQCWRNNNISFVNNSSISGASISSYAWEFGDNISSNLPSPHHSYDSAGTYTIYLYAVSDSGCRDTAIKQIVIYAHPSSNILASGPLVFCYNDSVVLSALYQAGSGTISTFEWLNNGIVINAANQPTIKIDATGSYSLVLENTYGCKDSSLIQPIIAHPLPVGFIQTNPPNATYICKGSELTLNVIASTATGYQWYFRDTTPASTYVMIPGANGTSYQATQAGNYSLSLSTSTNPVCRDSARGNISLMLIQKPVPNFSFPYYCANQPISLINSSDTSLSGAVTWSWNFGDLSPISNQFSPIHTYNVGTNYPINLTATPIKCPNLDSTISKIIPVQEPKPGIRYPTVNAVKNTNTPLQARLFGSRYLWTPSLGLNPSSTIPSLYYNYDRETDYTIKIETLAGCITYDSQLVRIFVAADIQVPTAFSPNGDGHNDQLDVFIIGITHLNFFKIFNRWGQEIFATTDKNKRWDGTFKGVKQPTETYVWIGEGEDMRGNKILKRGQFILLR